MSHGLTSSRVNQKFPRLNQKKANTAREALKRDANYTNASDDEKTGNSVNQLKRIGADVINYDSYWISGQIFWSEWRHNISNKSIIEHQKDSLRKVKREMCLTDEKLNILTEGNIITWFITLFIMWSTVNVKTINHMKTINVDWTSLKIYFNLI